MSAAGWLKGFRTGPLEALQEALPGLELLDSDLDLGAGPRADLVGVDGDGRATAVLLVDGGDPDVALRALDALAWLARHRAQLAEHLGSPRLDPALDPLVVLVAERYEERALERLAGLARDSVRCFERSTVASARAERTFLTPARFPFGDAAPADPTGIRSLLRALSPESAALASGLLRRLERIDDDIECAPDGQGQSWALEGERLCALHADQGALQGSVGRRAASALRSEREIDRFLEEVVGYFAHLLQPSPPASGDGGADAFDPGAQLLSPEEIAAFQEP
jgi:hypothetical protein